MLASAYRSSRSSNNLTSVPLPLSRSLALCFFCRRLLTRAGDQLSVVKPETRFLFALVFQENKGKREGSLRAQEKGMRREIRSTAAASISSSVTTRVLTSNLVETRADKISRL